MIALSLGTTSLLFLFSKLLLIVVHHLLRMHWLLRMILVRTGSFRPFLLTPAFVETYALRVVQVDRDIAVSPTRYSVGAGVFIIGW